jgi:hypothetical protein
LVEHTAENRGVAGSIPALATFLLAAAILAPQLSFGGRTASVRSAAPFAGAWWGHTRRLVIGRGGGAKEHIDDGCCIPVIDLEFRVTQAHGTWRTARAIATVIRVRYRNRQYFTKARPAPHVGETRIIRLKGGLLLESLTGAVYCNGRTKTPGRCGA